MFHNYSGTPNTDPWCRPQTDGPGIRGGTLADYALDLLTRGGDSYVKQYLWTGNPQVCKCVNCEIILLCCVILIFFSEKKSFSFLRIWIGRKWRSSQI